MEPMKEKDINWVSDIKDWATVFLILDTSDRVRVEAIENIAK